MQRHGDHDHFKPDTSIFTNIVEFDFDQIDSRLKETSFLNAGLRIVITDERSEEAHTEEHHYAGGISEFVKQINARRETLHPEPILIAGEKEIEKGPVSIELALQWSDAFSESIYCYTNIIRNKDVNPHVRPSHGVDEQHQRLRQEEKTAQERRLSGDDVREGLAAIVSVKHQTLRSRRKQRTNSSAAKSPALFKPWCTRN